MRVAADHRSEILKAAARLFARKRFHQVLMEDVAGQVGIAKGTLYRFFPTKEKLYAAICFEWLDSLHKELESAARGTQDVRARLREMIRRSVRHFATHRDFFQVMQRQETLKAFCVMPAFLERRAAFRDVYAGVIRKGCTQKVFRAVSPVLAADLLLGMLRSLLRFGDPRLSPEAAADTIAELFFNGIATVCQEGAHGAPAPVRSGRKSRARITSFKPEGRFKA